MWIGFFTISYSISAQKTDYKKDFAIADSLKALKAYNSSDSILQHIKSDSHKNLDWENWYGSINKLRKNAIAQNKYLQLKDSIELYLTQFPLEEKKLHVKLQYRLAIVSLRAARTTESIKQFYLALELSKETQDTSRYISSTKNLINCFLRISDNYSAIKLCKSGKTFSYNYKDNKDYNKFLHLEGNICYLNGEYQNAINLYKKLLVQNDGSTSLLLDLFAAYLELNDLKNAKVYLNDIDSTIIPREYFQSRSRFHELKGDITSAIKDRKKAVNFAKEEKDVRLNIKELTKLSHLYKQNNNFKEANQNAHLALALFYPSMDNSNINSKPPINSKIPEIWTIEAAFIKGQYYVNSTNKEVSNAAAVDADYYFDYIFEMYDRLRSNQLTLESRYKIGAYSQEMYSEAIDFYINQYQKKGNKAAYEKALKAAQLSNAYNLRLTVNQRQALEFAKVPEDLSRKFLDLNNQILAAQNEDDTPLLDSLIIPFEKLKSRIKNDYPKYGQLNQEELTTAIAVQENLKENQLILKYKFLKNQLLVFSISKKKIDLTKIEIDSSALEQIESLSKLMLKTNAIDETEFINLSRSVYNTVLSPILSQSLYQGKEHIIIVPDGPLKKISFSTLLHHDTDDWSNPENYLIDKYSLSYLYFLSQYKKPILDNSYDNEFIGFGIQYSDKTLDKISKNYLSGYQDSLAQLNPRSMTLSSLENADEEVIACSNIWNGNYFLDSQVNYHNITNSIKNTRIAHFAVHAIIDQEDHANSFIALDATKDTSSEFGYNDILSLDFAPELLVLSACQTNMGEEIKGEGLMSLARMFSQSGSNATLGSFWNVPDKPTMILMDLFYKNLKAGMSKSESLRRAQIQYMTDDNITTPSMRGPNYWGAWTLFGQNKAIQTHSTFSKYKFPLILLSILFITILFILFIKKTK